MKLKRITTLLLALVMTLGLLTPASFAAGSLTAEGEKSADGKLTVTVNSPAEYKDAKLILASYSGDGKMQDSIVKNGRPEKGSQ